MKKKGIMIWRRQKFKTDVLLKICKTLNVVINDIIETVKGGGNEVKGV